MSSSSAKSPPPTEDVHRRKFFVHRRTSSTFQEATTNNQTPPRISILSDTPAVSPIRPIPSSRLRSGYRAAFSVESGFETVPPPDYPDNGSPPPNYDVAVERERQSRLSSNSNERPWWNPFGRMSDRNRSNQRPNDAEPPGPDSIIDGEYGFEDNVELLPPSNPESDPTYNPDGTGSLYTVFLIVNAALGAGLLNFPKAFDAAGGIFVGCTIQGVLLAFIIAALFILAWASDKANMASTLQSTVEGVTNSTKLGTLCSLCVIVYCFGTTITFLIIIGDQFDRAFEDLFGPQFCDSWYLRRNFTIPASAILFILPFCYSKKIDFLRLPSAAGVLAILYINGLVVYEYFYGNFIPGPIKTHPDKWTDVFLVIPEVCFGYQCHVSVIPIYSCMKQRRFKNFVGVSSAAIAICAFCYTVTAVLGYLTFGSLVNADILMSYSAQDPKVMVAIVAMTLKTFTTYPILLYCGREGIKSLLPATEEGGRADITSRVVIASVWFAASVAMAVLIPNITIVIQFLGSLAAVFIFVMPGFALLELTLTNYDLEGQGQSSPFSRKFLMVVAIIFNAIGVFIFGVVFTQAVEVNFIQGYNQGNKFNNGGGGMSFNVTGDSKLICIS